MRFYYQISPEKSLLTRKRAKLTSWEVKGWKQKKTDKEQVTKKEETARLCDGKKRKKQRQFNRCLLSGTIFYYEKIKDCNHKSTGALNKQKKNDNFPKIVATEKDQTSRLANKSCPLKHYSTKTLSPVTYKKMSPKLTTFYLASHAQHHRNRETKTF